MLLILCILVNKELYLLYKVDDFIRGNDANFLKDSVKKRTIFIVALALLGTVGLAQHLSASTNDIEAKAITGVVPNGTISNMSNGGTAPTAGALVRVVDNDNGIICYYVHTSSSGAGAPWCYKVQ